jgi:hypothetical protein
MSQPVVEPVVTPPTDPGNEPGNEPAQKLSYEQMESELRKVRAEAASRRVALREQEEAAKKWSEYEESQKSELQKLQDAVAERDKRLEAKELEVTRAKIAREFEVDSEDLDLLVGDEENMKRLAARLGKKGQKSSAPDLLAGNRGTPVNKSGQSTTSFMDGLIRGNRR